MDPGKPPVVVTPVRTRAPSGQSRTMVRAGSRGSLSSTLSASKFGTWNPRSARGAPLTRASSLRFELDTSDRMSVGSAVSAASRATTASRMTARGAEEAPSVCVMVRIRPFLGGEKKVSCLEVLEANGEEDRPGPSEEEACLTKAGLRIGGDGGQTFFFDRVFRDDEGQEAVFIDAGKRIADNALRGFNASILAYGQTGSGKTFTMHGPENQEENRGLVPRVLEYCFGSLERLKREQGVVAVVHCSYLEIYKEQIFDLLDGPKKGDILPPGFTPTIKVVREDVRKGVFVENATECRIESVREAHAIMERGAQLRHIASTNMNRESSRSHSVFTLSLEIKFPGDEAKGTLETTRFSRVNLVDLAGSERQSATMASGERLTEARHINKSLSALGNVIAALVEKSKGRRDVLMHVPYRDSTLTFLLKDSLGGNTKTSIIATVSPDAVNFQETLSTLQFGQRAKRIKLRVRENMSQCSDVSVLRAEIERLRDELRQVRKMVGDSGAEPMPRVREQNGAEEDPIVGPECDGCAGSPAAPRAQDRPSSKLGASLLVPNAGLVSNADFCRLDNKVANAGAKALGGNASFAQNEDPADGQLVLRKRISHLERVLVEVLQELGQARESISALKTQNRTTKELSEVLRDQIGSKDLLLRLLEQKLKVFQEEGASQGLAFAQQSSGELKDLIHTEEELERQREIAILKAENTELAELYRLRSQEAGGEGENGVQRRITSYQVQLEAVLDDKAELERLLAELSDENSRLKREQDEALEAGPVKTTPVDGALEEELRAAKQLIEELQQQIFAEAEVQAASAAHQEKTRIAMDKKRVQETGSRRHSAGELHDQATAEQHPQTSSKVSLFVDVSSPTAPSRAALLSAAQATKSVLAKEAQEKRQLLAEQQVAVPSPSAAGSLVAKRLLRQLADARVQLTEMRHSNRRLSVQLERSTWSAKKQKHNLRKSLSAKETNIDMEQVKALQLELELADLRERYERVQMSNKDLQEAVEMANSFSDYKEKQLRLAMAEVESLKSKNAVGKENSGGFGNVKPDVSSPAASKMPSLTPFADKQKWASRDSNMTARMATFEDDDDVQSRNSSRLFAPSSANTTPVLMKSNSAAEPPERESIASATTAMQKLSISSERASISSVASYSSASVASSASKKERKPVSSMSVAEFFPSTDSVTSMAKNQVMGGSAAEPERLSSDSSSSVPEAPLSAQKKGLHSRLPASVRRSSSKKAGAAPKEARLTDSAIKRGSSKLKSMLGFGVTK